MPLASAIGMQMRIIVAAVAFATACSGSPGSPPATASRSQTAAPPATVNEHPNVTASSFRVEPATIRRGGAANVSADIPGAPANLQVDVSWFGEDGWNVADQTAPVSGGKATVAVPADVTARPGRYHAELRAGVDDLASVDLTVTD